MISLDWQFCFSMADLEEQFILEEWVRHEYERYGELRILEIGSYQGQSTSLLAQFGTVIAIDLFGNVDRGDKENYEHIGTGHFKEFISNMIRLRLIDKVFPIVSTSEVLNQMPNMGFDIIYIDGSHYKEDVQKDINNSFRHLKDSGLMILDDFQRPGRGYPGGDPSDPDYTLDPSKDPWIGVSQAVNEFVSLGEFGILDHKLGKVCLGRI